MATTKIFNFDLENDKNIIAKNEESQNLEGKLYIKDFFKYLQDKGLVKLNQDLIQNTAAQVIENHHNKK